MSLILDALKKLEREKAAQSNKTSDIAASILEQQPVVKNRKPMVLIGAIALTAAISMAGMYIVFLMNNKPAPLSAAAPLAPVPQPATGAAPLTPAPQPTTSPAPAETPAPRPAAAGPVKAAPAAAKESTIKEKAGPAKPKRGEPEKKASSPPPGTTPARPDFIISAIIWYEEPPERKAVVDGKSVREGDIIDGCRVEQIYPSRVIFVKDGKRFEVNMNR
jgi:hypothetical protein